MFFMDIAFAQANGAPAGPTFWEQMILPVGLFFIVYFFLIRPQARKVKEQQTFLDELKNGDEVVTAGGIIGRVKSISDDFVSLDLGGTSVKVIKDQLSKRMSAKDRREAQKK